MGTTSSSRIRRLLAAPVAVAALAALAGCEFGEASGVSHVTDISATLHGTVHSTDPTPRYWFEYDPDPTVVDGVLIFAHKSFENEWACCGPMTSASMDVSGLTPDTTYHYRFCIETETGGGTCGAPDSFTTRPANRDVVDGVVSIPIMPQLGYVDGVSVRVRAEPDSTLPVGRASRIPGSYYFRVEDEGEATCLRISGNRAAVGFVDSGAYSGEPGPPQVVFVEDNGPTGDRFGHLIVDEVPTECPDPATAEVTWKTATYGDVTVIDHEPLG
jgi:hypothetical protein